MSIEDEKQRRLADELGPLPQRDSNAENDDQSVRYTASIAWRTWKRCRAASAGRFSGGATANFTASDGTEFTVTIKPAETPIFTEYAGHEQA